MKKILILFYLVMLSSLNYAQSPDSINLQLQFFPIIYENSSDVLIQFLKNNETENYNFSFSVENITNPVLNVGNINYATNNYLASGLIPETSYFLHIYVDDEFGNQIETVQSPIEFRTKNEGMINVSSTLFNELSEWSANENQTINFQDFLTSLVNSISEYEIIYFIQRYFYKDARLNTPWIPGGDIGEFPIDPRTKPEGDPPFPPEDECLCNFVINKSALAIPNSGADCYYSPKTDKFDRTDPEKHWYRESKIGASHYAQLWEDGKNDSHHVSKGTVETADSGFSPEFLGLNWNYLCINYSTNLPVECECEKEVILNWNYSTRLTSAAPNQIFFFNDGGHAEAQDYAILVESDSKGNFDVLGAGRALVSTTCNTSFNPGFLKSLASLVVSIGNATQNVSASTIADVLSSLGDVLSTDFINKNGNCTFNDRTTTLTNGFRTVYLEPNIAKKIRLYSFFSVGVGGFGKWKPTARVLSDCYLDAVIMGSNDDDPNACCTDKHASWTIGHMPGSPTTINNLKENVGADIGLHGPWSNYPDLACCNPTVVCDWDCIIQPNLKCRGIYDDDQGNFTSPEPQYRTINDNLDFSIYPNPTAGILNINFTSKFVEMGRIEIFTISGKSIAVLYDGEFQKNNKLVLKLPNTISLGQYIVKVNSKNINHISNLIISK